jgi:bacterial/archaeal transporter family protein
MVAETSRPTVWTASVAGLMLVLADQLYMRAVAMDGALISVISLTRRSSVLVSFILGGLLFREGLLLKKLLPLTLILAGVLLLLF